MFYKQLSDLGTKGISDSILLKRLKRGSKKEVNETLTHIYKANYAVISRFIQRNNGSESDAKDIFQDSLIVLFENVKHKELNLTCSISTYLYSISRNLWLKRLKAKKISIRVEDVQDFISLPDEVLPHQSPELNTLLMGIFSHLTSKCREILTFFYYEDLSMKEIGKLTGYKSEQAVKNKKFKCMKELMSIISSSKKNERILRDFISA